MRVFTRILFVTLSLTVFCCAGIAPARAEAPMQVAVSIIPQKYFVEQIGGTLVEVEVMVPPGATPEQYEPKPKQMSALGRAKLYFACGVPFETTWLSRMASANPNIRLVRTDQGIAKREMEAHSHDGHKSRGGEKHSHHDHEGLKDPHIWLSPPLVMMQARAVFDALVSADPQNRQAYEDNYKKFIGEIVELDALLLRLLQKQNEPRAFMVFHPAWGYFAEAYGLKQVPVEIEGKEPKARDLDNFIKLARRLNIKTVFVQPQQSPRSAQTIADAVGANIAEADPLAPDWADNLRRVAERIASAVGEQ